MATDASDADGDARAGTRERTDERPTRGRTEIGIGLTSFGCGFTALGVVFFFDRGLLAMGNLMFLSGVTLTIGPRQTVKFFGRPRNQRGAFCFLFGLALVLYGWPFVGLCVEGYGFVALFSAFFPTVLIFL
ncbi:Got1/Sft2-like family-domain-containing protein, partial [Ostreococcus tauri]